MKKISLIVLIFSLSVFLVSCGSEEQQVELENQITGEVVAVEEAVVEEPEPEPVPEEPEILTVKLCHDTDNAINQWVSGEVFGFYDNAQRFEFADECKDERFLLEFYCEEEQPKQESILCKSGCMDAACR